MPLDLLSLPADDAERIAYAEGFTMAAELFARIAQLESINRALEAEIEDLKDNAKSFARWEQRNGPVELYKEFFDDCFTRLAGHYPAPSINSDYDKSVIFDAIEKGSDK